MLTILRYVCLTAFRDRLFFGLLVAIVLTTFISAALAGTSLIEKQEMTLAFSGAAARLIVIVGLIVFIGFHVRSAFDNKEIDVFLSRPISRTMLVVSYWLGFSFVAFILVALAAIIIAVVGPENHLGFIGWAASLFCETLLVVAMSLFTSLILKSASLSVVTTLGFYALSRMMGYFVATSNSNILFVNEAMNETARYVIQGIAIFIPRLDFFTKTEWLVYGFSTPASELSLFAVQAAVFIPLLLLAAMLDFWRKEF